MRISGWCKSRCDLGVTHPAKRFWAKVLGGSARKSPFPPATICRHLCCPPLRSDLDLPWERGRLPAPTRQAGLARVLG